jgi:hypothetical protein
MNTRAPRSSFLVACATVAWTLALPLAVPDRAVAQGVDQPRNLTATVVGNRVTLAWLPPLTVSQSPVLGYRIEAGGAPGAIAVALTLGASTLSYAVNAPNGVYFVRIRTLLPAGPAAVASTELQVTVPALPAAPRDLAATVVRFAIALRWLPGTGGGTATGWLVEAGSAPGLSDLARVPIGVFPRTLAATVPEGRYYVRVRALNASGASPPSNEIEVITGPTQCTFPNTPTGLTALAGELGVRLSWAQPTDALPTAYQLAVGTASGSTDVGIFSLPPAAILSTPAPPNTYFVRVAGVNACGPSPYSTEVSFTVRPDSGARLLGTWVGTVSNYSQPFPWSPITSFQLTLNTEPSWTTSFLGGSWIDNKGCRWGLIAGGIEGVPYISMESLPCNDGDFVLTVLSNTGSVATGTCNAGPNCTFRMTRR